jgi:hypothetical protein
MKRDTTTTAYVRAVTMAGFQSAIGPGVSVAAARYLEHPDAPGRRFVRMEGCTLRWALAALLRDLAETKRGGSAG